MARQVDLAGAAHLVLAAGVVHLDPQTAVFEAMVEGWARQQRSRLLAEGTVGKRVRLVRRFAEFTSEYPWSWQPGDVEEFSVSLRGDARAPSTIRAYQQALRLFCDFTDRGLSCTRRPPSPLLAASRTRLPTVPGTSVTFA